MIEYDSFSELDIRIGTILNINDFPNARKPAYKLEIDFGVEIGVLKSSAQITDLYNRKNLIGTQVVAIVNFPIKQIGNFFSQCLVLGVYTPNGVVLLRPERKCDKGLKIG